MKCNRCGQQFDYFSGEKEAYERKGFPAPENCQLCRQLRRMAFRNERYLYHKTSAKSGKKIIAIYPEQSPFKIIDSSEWWDDNFDATKYARDFDFSKSFFEQFAELQKEVPRWSRQYLNVENCDFTNNCANVCNSYLAFSCNDSKNLYYCMRINDSHDCFDCYSLFNSEYCYDVIQSDHCYNVHFSQLCENCSDSYFLFDCKGCRNCILCAGIKQGEYMILNTKYSKEEYEKLKADFLKLLHCDKQNINKQFETLKQGIFLKNNHNIMAENCNGEFISHSRNIQYGFNVVNSEDSINLYNCSKVKNCYDEYCSDLNELCIDCDTNYDLYNCNFITYCVGMKDCDYCDQCYYLKNSMGCIGLKQGQYMILNKQYSKEEYEKLRAKIDEHMRKIGEFGQPFPAYLTSFSYNETIAYESKPLTKEDALSQGFRWYEEEEGAKYFAREVEIPKDPKEYHQSICNKVLNCEASEKPYKIIPQEFEFCVRHGVPLPKKSPEQRYRDQLEKLNPMELRQTTCASCKKQMSTAYPKNTPYKIICEECYLKTI